MPTAIPQATAAIAESTTESTTESTMGEADHAPTFSQYWQPPTTVYGEPLEGGLLRIVYEDPLDHGNAGINQPTKGID
jgi:hypothetical protein